MSHLSQNLEKLIQMISIEQLLGLVKQNTENKSSSDIMNLPIVQKVVQAYEDEIQTLHSPSVKDYSNDIAKIHEQLSSINNNLLQLTEAIRNINITSNNSYNLMKYNCVIMLDKILKHTNQYLDDDVEAIEREV